MDYKVKLPDGSEIVLLYTDNFDWKDKEQKKAMSNTPKTGRVYRALKTKGDTTYYIHLDLPIKLGKKRIDGIRITSLDYTTPEWVCHFMELNEENILDFDIIPDDYNKIRNWLETKQEDLIKTLFTPNGVDVIASEDDIIENGSVGDLNLEQNVGDMMDMYKKSIEPYDNKAIEAIQFISMRDPFALQAISEFLGKYVEFMNKEDEVSVNPIRREICTSGELGKTANMTLLGDALDKYLRTSQEGPSALIFEMFLSVLFESMRTEINKPFEND